MKKLKEEENNSKEGLQGCQTNRPTYTEFNGGYRESFEWHLVNYIDSLNEYCSYLERRNKTLDGSNKFLRDMADELSKALDKACDELACLDYRIEMMRNPNNYYCDCKNSDQWKEWALSDD